MLDQMLVFRGFYSRGSCDVFLIFRQCRLWRVEYANGLSNRMIRVRTLYHLPNYVLASDFRERCVARWWITDDEIERIDFAGLGIDRSVVNDAYIIDGIARRALPITQKNVGA